MIDVSLGDVQKARKFAESKRVGSFNEKSEFREFGLCQDLDVLNPYGVGLRLFFQFLKFFTVLLLLMSVCAGVQMYLNFSGNAIEDGQTSFFSIVKQLMLGNQLTIELEILPENPTEDEISENKMKNDQIIKDYMVKILELRGQMVALDLIYSTIFILGVLYFSRRSDKIKEEVAQSVETPSMFTLKLTGFPITETNAENFKVMMQNVLSSDDSSRNYELVHECHLARSYFGVLSYLKDITDKSKAYQIKRRLKEEAIKERELLVVMDETEKESRIETAIDNDEELQKMSQEISKMYQDLNLIIKEQFGEPLKSKEYPATICFITFNKTQDKLKAFQILSEKSQNTFWYDLYPCCRRKIPPKYLLRGKFRVQPSLNVDEPSNIRWENLNVTTEERIFRFITVFLMLLIMMLVTFIVILLMNVFTPDTTLVCPNTQIDFRQAEDKPELKDCFCQQNLQNVRNDQIYNFCKTYFTAYLTNTFIGFAITIAIFLINSALTKVIEVSSKFQRFSTVTQEISQKTINLTIAMVLNTAFIYVLIKSEFNGFKLVGQISKVEKQLKSMQETNLRTFYPDFTREWYQDIGLKIVQTMILNIIMPVILYFTLDKILICINKFKAARKKYQYEMNDAMCDPEFELTLPYAASLNSLFITLIFAPALPILIPISSLTLFVQYWVNKANLFKRSSKPPQYDHNINSNILGYLKIAFFLHLLFALYIYSNQSIFPNSELQLRKNIQANLQDTQTQQFYGFEIFSNNDILERVNYQPEIVAYICFCIAIVVVRTQLQLLYNLCLSKLRSKAVVAPLPNLTPTQKDPYSQLQQKLSNQMLATYDIQKNPEYTNLIKAIDTGLYLQQFLQTDK